MLEYASNAEAWLARTPALFTRHTHQLTRHCYVIVLQQTSLFSIFRSHDRPRAQINQSQKYAADSPVVISPLYNFTSFTDCNSFVVDQSPTMQTYASWNPNSSCKNRPSTILQNSQGIPPMSELPLWQIHSSKLAYLMTPHGMIAPLATKPGNCISVNQMESSILGFELPKTVAN